MEIDCAKKRGDSHSFVTTDTYVVKFKFLDLKIKPFDISNRLRFIKCFAGWPGLQVVFFEDLLEKRCVASNISRSRSKTDSLPFPTIGLSSRPAATVIACDGGGGGGGGILLSNQTCL